VIQCLANRTIYGVRTPLWPHRVVCRRPLLRKFVLDLGPLVVGFAVDEVVVGLIFLRSFRFCLFSFILPLLHIHNSLTYQRRCIILAAESTVKKKTFLYLSTSLSLSSLHYFNPFARKSLKLCTYITLRHEFSRQCLIRDEF